MRAVAVTSMVAVMAGAGARALPASAAGTGPILCEGYAACSTAPFNDHGYPQHEGTSYWQMYAGDNCTNYVAYVESTVFGVATPTYDLGDADEWASTAAQNGALVDATPAVGAVAVWLEDSAGVPGTGHVAVVEAVGPNGSYIEVSQQHMIATDGYDWVRLYPHAGPNQWEQWPNAFIHFKVVDAPLAGGRLTRLIQATKGIRAVARRP